MQDIREICSNNALARVRQVSSDWQIVSVRQAQGDKRMIGGILNWSSLMSKATDIAGIILRERPVLTEFAVGGTQSRPTRRICVIGVPLDLGASRRGVDMGPSAVRVAGLEARLEALGHQVRDGGNIRVEIAETQNSGAANARFLQQIADTCTRTAEAVSQCLEDRKSVV